MDSHLHKYNDIFVVCELKIEFILSKKQASRMAKLLKEASITDQNGNVSPTPESSPNNTDDDGIKRDWS